MPIAPTGDYYMIIPLAQTEDVYAAAQVFVATGISDEDAIAKVAAIVTDAQLFTSQVVQTFPPPAAP